MDNKEFFLRLAHLDQFQNHKVLIKKVYDLSSDLNKPPSSLTKKECEMFKLITDASLKVDLKKVKESLDKENISFLAYCEKNYPLKLKKISDPPFCLFYKGNLDLFSYKSVGIVGTRTPTNYGTSIAKKISSLFAELDIVVVSGLASGIDSCAHLGALKSGKTIAVLGTGVDIIFPLSNKDLYWNILDKKGLILSEYSAGTPSSPWNFPQRNRIISALSDAVIVVEGSLQSGSLITARFAIKQEKPLFAIPGPITETMSNGPNILIKSRVSELFCSVNDVLEKISKESVKQLDLKLASSEPSDLSDKQKEIYKLLEKAPKDFDFLLGEARINVSELTANLSILELKGCIEKTNDGNYVRI